MRELKFRAWDHVDKIMFTPETGNNNECFFTGLKSGKLVCLPNEYADATYSYYELMQFTGLKDKEGNEIYEGDILKRTVHLVMYGTDLDKHIDEYLKVEYREEYAGFYIGEISLLDYVGTTTDVDTRCSCTESEVVGNVYEDKELLEGGN